MALLRDNNDGGAPSRSVGRGAQEAAAIVASSSPTNGGTVVERTKAGYEQNIRLNQERDRREQEIFKIEEKLRSSRLMTRKKRQSLELQMEEAKEAVRILSRLSFDDDGGGGLPIALRRMSNSELKGSGNAGVGTLTSERSMTLEEIEVEKAKIKAQINAIVSLGASVGAGAAGGGGGGRPRRRISITESTMVIETVMDNNPPSSQEGDDAAGPDASISSHVESLNFLSQLDCSNRSQTFFVDDMSEEPALREEQDLQDATDAVVVARLRAGRPLRRSSSLMEESETERELGGAADATDTTPTSTMAMLDFYNPRGSATKSSPKASLNESESSTDLELLNDGPYSNRRSSYRSDSDIDVPWEESSEKPQSEMPKKSILKRAPYRPARRGSGIHSDEFESWNPKVSSLSRKLYMLQQEAEAREESIKAISAEMVGKKDKNGKQIHKLMGHIRKLHKDNQETPMQLRYWQEKATELSKKVYDLELLLEEQDENINELLEFKEIQSERIETLEEEVLQNRKDTFNSMVEEEGAPKKPMKKRLSRRASVDMTMQKSLRRASSCQSVDEQVKEEAKLEIVALESRLSKVNEEQAQLQRELDSMRSLLETTQQEPTEYQEKLIIKEKKVVRERVIYQLSCHQCKGKDFNFVATTMLDIVDQVDVHFQEVAQQVQKMNGKGRRSESVFTEGTNSTKWSATFAQHFAKHCRKKCKCADDVVKYCRKNVKIEILKKEDGAELYWNDYEE